MRTGTVAKKIGMTSLFDEDGSRNPVTILSIEDSEVTNLRTIDKNNYIAIQVGLEDLKQSKINKPQKNSIAKSKSAAKKFLKEFKVSENNILEIGTKITVDHYKKGQFVDITAKSIGKGFAGAMKRHNFSGLRASHGTSVSHRSHGSTGNNQDPGRVFKGKKMAGHMGAKKVTVQNLKILEVDKEKNILIVKGSVPGPENTIVYIKDSVKKRKLI
tara:strand:+ start:1015 stop:1659 length:645 start_codon:yes stop_codon:yes gene_type:complete